MKKIYFLSAIFLTFSIFYLFYLDSSKAQDSSIIETREEKPQGRSYDLNNSFINLLMKAREKGTVPVIVGFRFDLEQEGYLTNSEKENQRLHIKQSQDSLLEKLTRSRSIKAVQYQTIPYLALAADVETLELLKGLPEVTFIGEDEVQFPALAESTVRINAHQAWSAGYSGQGQVIAILDTGVDKTHPFLTGKVISEACFSANVPRPMVSSVCPGGDTQSTAVNSGLNCTFNDEECTHGTHVAGIAAGRSLVGNRQGVAKDANIVAIQVFSRYDNPEDCPKSPAPCVGTHLTDYTLALEQVMNLKQGGMSIASANLSIGGGNYSSFCDIDFPFLRDAINHLRTLNVATVAASGNDGFTSAMSRPACISSAISVGSTNDGSNGTTVDVISTFMNGGASNSADFLSLLAPGKWIDSSVLNGGYDNFEGTSMAAPHVAGAWAILKQRAPTASVTQVLNALRTTGQSVTDSRNGITKPRILIDAALQALGNETTSETKLLASIHLEEERFGSRVAISGDTAVVGAPRLSGIEVSPGSAYVFVRDSNGTWTQQARLTAPDSGVAKFGSSVAIEGDTILVGSIADNIGANVDQGSVHVFVRNGTTWTRQARLIASDGAPSNQLGTFVNISGNTVVAGALGPGNAVPGINGYAYVFVRNGTTWTQQQKLTSSDGAEHDYFGAVAIYGDTIIVGAWGDDIGIIDNQGSAYVFVRNGTTWTQQQKLTASDASFDNLGFGYRVAMEGDTAIIGKFVGGLPLMGTQPEGGVYIFNKIGNVWTQTQKLLADNDGVVNKQFGGYLAISGNQIVVGTPGDKIGENQAQGSTYIFAKNGTTWTRQQKLMASDGIAIDLFGTSVAMSGNTIIIGAPKQTNQGAVYIFTYTFNVRNIPFDFDGDGKADISIFRPSNGEWWYQRSSNNQVSALQFGAGTDKIVPADYTGDGKTDVAVFRPSTGEWFVLRSEDNSFYGFPFGASGDIPAPADFDGDGKSDPTVFRPSTATWFTQASSGGVLIRQFGQTGDIPQTGDYDADGKADLAIYRPNGASFGEWWVNRSTAGLFAVQFGISTDKPVAQDYTGDGKTDIAIWRPSEGNWYILRSEDYSYYAFPFGSLTDIPAPGDYDGDGRADATVFRPSNATWYSLRSTQGMLIQSFGQTGDLPAPSAFAR